MGGERMPECVGDGPRATAAGDSDAKRRPAGTERQSLVLDTCDDCRQQDGGTRLDGAAHRATRSLCDEREQRQGAEWRKQRARGEQQARARVAPGECEPSCSERRKQDGEAQRDVGEWEERHEQRGCSARAWSSNRKRTSACCERQRPACGEERQRRCHPAGPEGGKRAGQHPLA
jgi:hypothetical protein